MALTQVPSTFDDASRDFFGWRVLRGLVASGSADTALTGDQLSRTFAQLAASSAAFTYIRVPRIQAMQIQCWGAGSDGDQNTMNIYGWKDNGPGFLLSTTVLDLSTAISQDSANAAPGFHNDTLVNTTLRTTFTATTDYRCVDTYATSVDAFDAVTDRSFTNLPGCMELDLSRLQVDIIAALFTTVNSTNVMAAYRPIALRERGLEIV